MYTCIYNIYPASIYSKTLFEEALHLTEVKIKGKTQHGNSESIKSVAECSASAGAK